MAQRVDRIARGRVYFARLPGVGDPHVPVEAGNGGLERDSFILCHEITTLDARDFRREVGALTASTLVRVEEALRAALDL